MTAKTLMIQGSSSSAGKSFFVTALCHYFARKGIRTAPYKAQNMSNNAAVCPDGAEIGRAQAVQAAAAGIEPSVEMNPILIKPEADSRSQIVLMGKAWKTLEARDYAPQKPLLWEAITASLDQLRSSYDLIIIEGAGSPAELNLKDGDLVNMAVARYAGSPVLLIGDIDRGGIFAQLLGTYWLLPPAEKKLLKGFIVNKFRGDPSLFVDGVSILEEKSGLPVVGVFPYLSDLNLPEEDAVALEIPRSFERKTKTDGLEIAVIHLPRIANFDDFDPLASENGVRIRYVSTPGELLNSDAVIIPGTKSTAKDLEWLRSRGFGKALQDYAARGGNVVGICGGYQMLGRVIHDPHGVESDHQFLEGLNLLPTETTFLPQKTTHRVECQIRFSLPWLPENEDLTLRGYEIHMGHTREEQPWLKIKRRGSQAGKILDGSISDDGRVWGCYIHGIFQNTFFRRAWLESLGWIPETETEVETDLFQASLARLADILETSFRMNLLEKWIWER